MKEDSGYRDLAAETYDLWFSGSHFKDVDFYFNKIKEIPGSALDIGCGTGRLLIPYIQAGLDVEGIDSSADMLKICEEKAKAKSIRPKLYNQFMQELSLPRKYATIFIPSGSFMLVTNREEAFNALSCFYSHLDIGGQLLLTTHLSWGQTRFIPREDLPLHPSKNWMLRRSSTRPSDGAEIIVSEAFINNYVEQIHHAWYRYEVYRDGQLIQTYLQKMRIRWYAKYELLLMLEKVGFRDITISGDYENTDAAEEHSTFIYRAVK